MKKTQEDNDIVVSVKNIAKDFYLPHEKSSRSLKSNIVNVFKKKDKEIDTQHALRDISFDIKKGEFFGIVGRNGSGKSTLLKILAGIYQPTKGKIKTKGKIVTFIELGVGFNPELSGRENVYLNGALLGFSREEIEAKYDEIVQFAELEDFMEQKLKNYSSGMQVRLAFSVAIKAEGDILVLDEVLAVGDEAFQRKCDDFFKQMKKDEKKTIILVTHNMESVKRYCDKAALIENGYIKKLGVASDVADQYSVDNFGSSKNLENAVHDENRKIREKYQLSIESLSETILKQGDKCNLKIQCFTKKNELLKVRVDINDDVSGALILTNKTKIVKEGHNCFEYSFPVEDFNNISFTARAFLEDDDKNLIAFTDDRSSCHFLVRRSKEDKRGLIDTDSENGGGWVK